MGAFPFLLLGLLPVLAFGQWQGSYAVSARTEAAGRTPYAQDLLTAAHSVDVEFFPMAQTEASWGAWHFSGVYAPTLRMREVNAGPVEYEDGRTALGRRFEHYHRLAWLSDYRREGSIRPYMRQVFSYGRMDLLAAFTGLPSPPGAPLNPRPIPSQNVGRFVLEDVVLETETGMDFPLSRRGVLTAFVGYFWGGGLTPQAREVVSMARMPLGGVRAQWQLTSKDTLMLSLASRYGFFLSHQAEAGALEFYKTWRRSLDEQSTLELSAGASAYGGRPAPLGPDYPGTLWEQKAPLGWQASPYAALHFLRHFSWGGQGAAAELAGKVAPFVDRYMALAYERVEASINLRWWWEDVYANAHGGLGRGLGLKAEQLSMTAYFAEAAIGYRVSSHFRAELRGSYASLPWARLGGEAGESPFLRTSQWRAALGLTLEYSGSY